MTFDREEIELETQIMAKRAQLVWAYDQIRKAKDFAFDLGREQDELIRRLSDIRFKKDFMQ
jgi:hypothetical protein